jgi:hypothetical protein
MTLFEQDDSPEPDEVFDIDGYWDLDGNFSWGTMVALSHPHFYSIQSVLCKRCCLLSPYGIHGVASPDHP